VTDMPDEEIVWEAWERIPDDLVLWSHGDELAAGHFTDRTYDWWTSQLGHHERGPGGCKDCGDVCLLAVFHEAVAISVIRELLRQGLLNIDTGTRYTSTTNQEEGTES